MTLRALAAAGAVALLGAAPAPEASPAVQQITVMCTSTPFYYYPRFSTPNDAPVRSSEPPAIPGQRFQALGMRTTLQNVQFVETNVGADLDLDAVPNSHLYLLRTCTNPG